MDDLKNLEEVLEILKAQEEMQDILEDQQNEIEILEIKNLSLQEQLDESMSLNEQLTTQTKELSRQIRNFLGILGVLALPIGVFLAVSGQ